MTDTPHPPIYAKKPALSIRQPTAKTVDKTAARGNVARHILRGVAATPQNVDGKAQRP